MKNIFTKGIGMAITSLLIATQFTITAPLVAQASSNTNIPKLTYRAHVQDFGWETSYKTASGASALSIKVPSSNNVAGSVGKSKRMEALEINFEAPKGVTLKYRAHVQDYGWMNWVTADNKVGTNYAGTAGKAKRVEAFQLAVEGLENYQIKYRVHAQDYGWLDWVTAGTSTNTATTAKGSYAGTVGQSKRMEALEIVVIPTNTNTNKSTTNTASASKMLTYGAHVQDYGWETNYKTVGGESELNVKTPSANSVAGTMGKAKRMEALEINFSAPSGTKLKYRAHVQDYGWMNWVTADNVEGTNYAGTSGEAKRVEAFQLVVEGLENYDIKYRVHVQDYGWMDWVTAKKSTSTATIQKGNYAGTMGEGKRMEALEIIAVPSSKAKLELEAKAKAEAMQKAEAEAKAKAETMQKAEAKAKAETMQKTEAETKANKEKSQPQAETTPKVESETKQNTSVEKENNETEKDIQSQSKTEDKTVQDNHEHTYTEWQVAKPSNCVYDGVETRTCEECGKTETRAIKGGHKLQEAPWLNKEATCTTKGEIKHSLCTVCGQDFFDYTKELGHNWKEEYTTVEATCEKDGETYQGCTRCNAKNNVTVIPKTGHDFEKEEIKVTCTENGKIISKCKNCDKEEIQITQRATGHKYGKYTYNNDATCMQDGTESKTCDICGEIYTHTKTGTKLAHNYEVIEEAVPPTCTHDGYTEVKKCTNCNSKIGGARIPANGQHDWVEETIEARNTCIGSIVKKTCKNCQAIEIVNRSTIGTGHVWTTEENFEDAVCTKCGEHAPNWTNTWSYTIYQPALAKALKESGDSKYRDMSEEDILAKVREFRLSYNNLMNTENGIKILNEELAKTGGDRHRIVWFIGYIANLDECVGFENGKACDYDAVITADWKFKREAPAAREGYRFDGWYNVGTDKLVTKSTTLETTWKDEDKVFEARYQKIK